MRTKENTEFGIWCTVSGGVTGMREAWMKDGDGRRAVYRDHREAQAEAEKANRSVGNHPYARFTYTVCEID